MYIAVLNIANMLGGVSFSSLLYLNISEAKGRLFGHESRAERVRQMSVGHINLSITDFEEIPPFLKSNKS